MRRDDRYLDGLTRGGDASLDGWAAGPQSGGQPPPSAPWPGADSGGRSGLGGLWLLLAPVACCGGPFLIAALAAAGALAWGGLGLGIALLVAVVAVILVRRRRRSQACCEPGAAGWAENARTAAAPRPTAR